MSQLKEIEFTDEEIQSYFKKYTETYRKFVDEKHPDLKGELSKYSGYPFTVTVYITKKSAVIEYKLNTPSFEIKINRVQELPKLESRAGYLLSSCVNIYLKRLMKILNSRLSET